MITSPMHIYIPMYSNLLSLFHSPSSSLFPASSNSNTTPQAPLAGHYHHPPNPFSPPQIPPPHSPPSPPPFPTTTPSSSTSFTKKTSKNPSSPPKLHHHLHHRSLHQAYHLHLLVNLFPADYRFVPRSIVCKISLCQVELDLHLQPPSLSCEDRPTPFGLGAVHFIGGKTLGRYPPLGLGPSFSASDASQDQF